ncbi:alpha/beta-hydrolase [Ophiobolus disseminans]|uniref:Alpha/beta-hydrolase n=1 Tax=Ophiobolus disseminans TaxID=1469910 RepID=A0A6A7AEC7_9PLEO|nr:alpha/beta-hydrolase [Ophiobolus disseminans]
MSSAKFNTKTNTHIPPLIIPPTSTHKTTLIILHGRGSTADKIAHPLLAHPVSHLASATNPDANVDPAEPTSFQAHFPSTKFIFPTAPLRRAAAFNRSSIHQWFDNWSLTEPEVKQHLQVPGLRETTQYLHGLLREEIALVGMGNVVLMGLSQGAASSLIAAMLWEGQEDEDGNGEDMFDRGEGDDGGGTRFERAVRWLREELDVENEGSGCVGEMPAMQSMPVFIGHGTDDEKVPVRFGKMAAEFLAGLDVGVEWKEYEALGHWYSADMLRDIVAFLKGLKG